MMTRGERAKLFAPFDAMKGLKEALADREERHSRVARHEISEEEGEKISRVLQRLERGTYVEIYCYSSFHDVVKRGRVDSVDPVYKRIILDGEKISFDDIYSIDEQ